jgi:putative membrane-bound dehydrogenase-like protein
MRLPCLRWGRVGLALLVLATGIGPLQADDLGFRVAPGFRVRLYADHDLANDIFAMTLDAQGRVVVTGPGYIKTLHDTRGAGKADKATLFATPPTGGMGMCFDGNDLYFTGGGWMSRYRDATGKGQADGPPEHLIPLKYGEHGGHAMRKGPDGCWYVIGGNDAGISRSHATSRRSPIKDPEGGALLRLSPDGKECEIVAHGFRNPYDFDFNETGDLFTYDSDVEREFFLPWYTPTRIYHIAHAGHHGWRLPGYLRSWCRPGFYLDCVDVLWPVGRGSPTGVVCYRHQQFPKHYRGGLFALDWTFGKVYFFPLRAEDASYTTRPEVFLESTGTSGFDPTDIVVAPDGSLFICMGGRGTRGAVYRVEYVGDSKSPREPLPIPKSELDGILHAPQPLDAWSRARWEPSARRLGAQSFITAMTDSQWDVPARIRAIEILTELFGGLPPDQAFVVAKDSSPLIRARVAWSLGRRPYEGCGNTLAQLACDQHPRVRRCALESLADRQAELDDSIFRVPVEANLGASSKRVRQAAARLAAFLSPRARRQIGVRMVFRHDLEAKPEIGLTWALALIWSHGADSARESILQDLVLSALDHKESPEMQLQAVRLIMMLLGDYCLQSPSHEIYTGYSLSRKVEDYAHLRRLALEKLHGIFPAGEARLNEECARLLAMLEDDAQPTPHKVAAFWTEQSAPTQDLHYLIVFSRLRAAADPALTTRVAQTLLGLHRKLAGREQRIKQTWGDRLSELVANLLQQDPHLADELLRNANFVNPGHVALALGLDLEHRKQAARLFLEAAKKDADFPWSGSLLELLGGLPLREIRPLLRSQWSNYGLRDDLLLRLADNPEAPDRDKFLTGLDSNQPLVIRACLGALEHLPRDETPKNLVPVLRLLRRLCQEPKEAALRSQALALLCRQAAVTLAIQEKKTDASALKATYQPVFSWFEKQYPALVKTLNDTGAEDPALWEKILQQVDWTQGKAARGELLFRNRACQTCHAGARALGPDLTGVASRFSRADLFTAIIYPSRDVAPAYRVQVVETKQGQVHSGIVAFESADGIILQTGATTTVRIATEDLVSRLPSNRSLMPDGLLKDLKPADLADLYAYLQSLKPKG